MKRFELLAAAAACCIAAGAFVNWGAGWALIVFGALACAWGLMFVFEVPDATDRQTRGT